MESECQKLILKNQTFFLAFVFQDRLTIVTEQMVSKTLTLNAKHTDHHSKLVCRADPPGEWEGEPLQCVVGPLDVRTNWITFSFLI